MPDPELHALQVIADALADLEQPARERVIRWSAERFDVSLPGRRSGPAAAHRAEGEDGDDRAEPSFTHFVDLFDLVSPKTDLERALTGAYWLQVVQGAESWPSQSVNNLLKDTGHGITNVTASLTKAQQRKPALVRQVSKSGRTAQARKSYKLTTAGVGFIRAALGGAAGPDEAED